MHETYDKQKQFTLTPKDFFEKLDFLNWYRYFAIVKELSRLAPKTILEIGPGEGTVRRVYAPYAERYAVADVNPRLSPDFTGDVRTRFKEAEGAFDAVIAADILEHIPFADVQDALCNIKSYLQEDGYALITIPHQAWFVFYMSWITYAHHILRAPDFVRTLFQQMRGRKINSIDRDHEWEIGDGKHSASDVERVMRNAGFEIEKREKLLYVDFWVLKSKPPATNASA